MSNETRDEGRDGRSPMQRLAEQEVAYHSTPLPEAQAPPVEPFPPPVVRGIWLGLLAGALLGLLVHVLLRNNLVVLPGAEGLYSMAPATFAAFWITAGAAVGLAVVGVIALFMARPAARSDKRNGRGRPS